MGQSIIGQEAMVERLLLGLLANGHMLVEGLPGLAKTRAIKSLAKNLDSSFHAFSSLPTCCRPISPAPRSISARAARASSSSSRVRSSPI
jgi:Mg-chelatase subunit ChlI